MLHHFPTFFCNISNIFFLNYPTLQRYTCNISNNGASGGQAGAMAPPMIIFFLKKPFKICDVHLAPLSCIPGSVPAYDRDRRRRRKGQGALTEELGQGRMGGTPEGAGRRALTRRSSSGWHV
jgi:hypothetical protein